MAEFTLEALKDEIVNDSEGIGYKNGTWKAHQVVADLINDPALGATITRKLIQSSELKASFDLDEFVALSQGERDYLLCLISGEGPIDANEALILSALTSMFGAGSTTSTTLLTKIQRQGSRAEILWGENTIIDLGQVGRAFKEV